jgi:hypothetical protein
MLISKKILHELQSCEKLSFAKMCDGFTYLVCENIYIASRNMKINERYVIEAENKYPALFVKFYLPCDENINTLISFLRVNDEISIALKDHPLYMDDLMLIEIHMLIERNNKGKEKHYDFLLDVTSEKYL